MAAADLVIAVAQWKKNNQVDNHPLGAGRAGGSSRSWGGAWVCDERSQFGSDRAGTDNGSTNADTLQHRR